MPSSIDEARAQLQTAQGILKGAQAQGRGLTEDEHKLVESLYEKAERNHVAHKVAAFGEALSGAPDISPYTGGTGMGDAFVRSEQYKAIQHSRGRNWSTGPVEAPYAMKGTLLEGAGAPGSGTGGGLIPVPQVVPGVVSKLFNPLTLEGSAGVRPGAQ